MGIDDYIRSLYINYNIYFMYYVYLCVYMSVYL